MRWQAELSSRRDRSNNRRRAIESLGQAEQLQQRASIERAFHLVVSDDVVRLVRIKRRRRHERREDDADERLIRTAV